MKILDKMSGIVQESLYNALSRMAGEPINGNIATTQINGVLTYFVYVNEIIGYIAHEHYVNLQRILANIQSEQLRKKEWQEWKNQIETENNNGDLGKLVDILFDPEYASYLDSMNSQNDEDAEVDESTDSDDGNEATLVEEFNVKELLEGPLLSRTNSPYKNKKPRKSSNHKLHKLHKPNPTLSKFSKTRPRNGGKFVKILN